MSKTGVIVALVVAVVLAVAAAIVLRPTPPQAVRRALLPFHPSEAAAIRVHTVGGDEHAIERQRRGGWVWIASDGGRWPIDRTRIDSALRKLAELSAEPDRDGGEWKAWPSFTVTLDDESVWEMWCEGSEIGGHRSVRVQPPGESAFTARVEGAILKALIETGLAEWREKLALPGLSLDVARVRLESAVGVIQLARHRGQWRMVEPVAVAADNAAVELLLRNLAAVQVSRFVTGDIDRQALGLDDPISIVTVEREIVSGTAQSPVRQSEVRTLIIGAPADVANTRFSAEVKGTLTQPDGTVDKNTSTVIEVGTKGLQRINPTPSTYISRRAAETSASNVGAVTISTVEGNVRIDKTIEGWFKRIAIDSTSDRERVLLKDEELLARFLVELCDADAASVSIGPHGDVEELFEIVLGSLTGQPLESLSLGHTVAGEIIASKGEVYWSVTGNFEDAIAWFIEQARQSDG